MTDEELSKMISEFLPYPAEGQHYALKQFAKLVAAAEREKFCSDLRALHDVYSLQSVSTIRERGAP